jgi:hypothetical protein
MGDNDSSYGGDDVFCRYKYSRTQLYFVNPTFDVIALPAHWIITILAKGCVTISPLEYPNKVAHAMYPISHTTQTTQP